MKKRKRYPGKLTATADPGRVRRILGVRFNYAKMQPMADNLRKLEKVAW